MDRISERGHEMSKYILMHKDNPVAALEIDEASGVIPAIGEVYAEEHIPLGITVKRGRIERSELNDWWKGRAIPASRSGIKTVLEDLQIATTQRLLEKCLGLSLSDQYWICPQSRNLKWSEINFFENNFSDDMGNILFGKVSSGEMILNDEISLMSPDNTSDGWLKKKWTIIDGKRCLIKSGSAPFFQEPLNEKITSILQSRLNYMPFVDYDLIFDDEQPLSVCENFITPQTELISAYSIYETLPKEKNISSYEHFKRCCEIQGIANTEKFLNYMLAVDYIIANSDRHFRNFGVIRNANTLEWIGFAPLFDCGTSLWFNQIAKNIKPIKYDESKPFATSHAKQIGFVTDLTWLDFQKLNGIENDCKKILSSSKYIDETRCENICYSISKRIDMLKDLL